MPGALAELLPYDPVGAAVVTVRATTDDDASVCALNGVAWTPALLKAGSFGLDLFSAGFPGFAAAPSGQIEIDLSAFPDAARYSWGDRAVTIRTGEPGDSWPWPVFFQGLVSAATVRGGVLKLSLRADDAWLDRPVLPTYAGTGGIEGPASLKGAPRPLAFGAPRFIAPQLLNATTNVWQFHGSGTARAVSVALDRLVRYSAAAGNDANLAALEAATIPPGAWRTCLAQGLVRFGAPPAGPMTLIVEGDNGTGAGWIRRTGAIIERIALLAGATAGQIDSVNLAALDTAVPRNISLYLTAQTTAREAIAALAAGVNGIAMIGLDGKLRVVTAAIGSPVLTLAADGSAIPQILPPELLETGAPFWRTAFTADQAWRVHAAGEFYDTANAAPSLSLAGTFVSVNADFATGAVLAGQLPKAIKATRKRGDVDVSATTTWTLSDSAITTAIDANGLLEISAVAGTGYVDVISNRDGVELRQRVTVQKVLGQPPSAGGGGATTATDTSIGNVTSASYGTVHGGPLTVRAGAAGTVALTAPLSFSATPAGGVGTFGLRGKWQWRIVGGSWADVATEITESSPDEVYDEGGGFYYSLGTGAIEVNQTKTGLTNGTDYEFQLLLRTPSGTRTRSVFDGTATAVAS